MTEFGKHTIQLGRKAVNPSGTDLLPSCKNWVGLELYIGILFTQNREWFKGLNQRKGEFHKKSKSSTQMYREVVLKFFWEEC